VGRVDELARKIERQAQAPVLGIRCSIAMG
jgi:hypothetical protein